MRRDAVGAEGLSPLRRSLSATVFDAILRQFEECAQDATLMALSRYAENGVFTPARIAGALRTTRDEVARTAGLGRDAVLRKDRIASPKTQKRLREMVEILNKIEPRFGSELIAYAWYRSEPLPGFSGQTAMQLVRAGRAADVLDYIDAVDAGVYA
jgi:hypothetical protein